MKRKKPTLKKLSCLLVMTLLINLIYWPSIVKAEEKERLYINFSKQSPQEPGESIEIISSNSGFSYYGNYSYYIKEIGGEYTALKENVSDKSIIWTPEESGKYIVKVVFNNNGKEYETEKSFEITEDKKGTIDYIGLSDGDALTFRDVKIPVKATIPKECGEDKYRIRCEFNGKGQMMDPMFDYLVGPGEIRAYVDFFHQYHFLDKINQHVKIELVNTTKERVEDVKEFDVKILSPGARHDLNITEKEENVVGSPIEVSLDSAIGDLEEATYSFYYRDMNTYKKYPIVEESKNKNTQFIPNKPGVYEISGEINCFGIRKSYYSTVIINGSEINLDTNNIFKEIKINYSYDKDSIYVNKGIQITSESTRNEKTIKGKVYVKSPISEKYELVKSISSEEDPDNWFYNTDKYIPKVSGEYKVRTEISYHDETVVEEDSFYAKYIPEDNRSILLESVEVAHVKYSDSSNISEYFLIETLLGENSYNKKSNVGLTLTMRRGAEEIDSRYYVIGKNQARNIFTRVIRDPGDYTIDLEAGDYSIDLEFKNIDIENSEIIKKSFNFTVDYKPIENLRLELQKEEIILDEEVEIVAFSDSNNEENCEYSFYSRKKGTENYTPIIERTESSVARFNPSEVGEYEFKVIAHGSLKDYVFEGGTLIANYAKGDINKDGEVTVLDLSIIADKYNSKKGEDNWSEEYDLNNDDVIDIYDLVTVAKVI